MKLNEFNVIIYNYNERKFEPYNIMEFLHYEYKIHGNELENNEFETIKKFILQYSMYQFMSRCEYEIILTDWPNKSVSEKWDIFYQIEMNIDIITKIFIENYIKNIN